MQLKVMITFLLCTHGHGGKAMETEAWVEGPLGNPFMRAKVFNQIFFFPSVSAGHPHGQHR